MTVTFAGNGVRIEPKEARCTVSCGLSLYEAYAKPEIIDKPWMFEAVESVKLAYEEPAATTYVGNLTDDDVLGNCSVKAGNRGQTRDSYLHHVIAWVLLFRVNA